MLKSPLLFSVLFVSMGSGLYCADITIPLEDGSIVVENPRLVMERYAVAVPGLSFTLRNRTSSPWKELKLQFEIDAHCNGEAKHWSRTEDTFLGWMGDPTFQGPESLELRERGSWTVREYTNVMVFPQGRMDGCGEETITVALLQAENSRFRINGLTGERIDLQKQRESEARAKAEQERIAAEERAENDRATAEEQTKKDAAQAIRQKRLAAERKRKQAEESAREAKVQAEQDAKEAEARAKIRAACNTIYRNTVDKKIKDLTVREEQQVRTCQGLGLYPPQ
jgi:hypothetical protein